MNRECDCIVRILGGHCFHPLNHVPKQTARTLHLIRVVKDAIHAQPPEAT